MTKSRLARWGTMPEGASEALFPTPGTRLSVSGDPLTIPVGVGRRVVVVANFALGPTATPATTWAASASPGR